MFDLFRKKNNTSSIQKLLEKIFINIDEPQYLEQIRKGAIKKIIPSFDNKGFDLFYSEIADDFEDLSKPEIIFNNIKVLNSKNQSTKVKLTIINNLVGGIDYTDADFDFSDVLNIDVSNYFKSISITNEYFTERLQEAKIDKNLTFKPSQIYLLSINGQEYIHLREISDGDFIALSNKKLYWITHEDLSIQEVPKMLEGKLKSNISILKNDELEKMLNDDSF